MHLQKVNRMSEKMKKDNFVHIKYLKELIDSKVIRSILLIVCLRVILLLISLLPAYIIVIIFNEILPNFEVKVLFFTLILFLAFFACINLFEYWMSKSNIRTFNILIKRAQEKIIDSILEKDIFSVRKYSEGDIIYRSRQDTENFIRKNMYLYIEVPINLFFLIIAGSLLFLISLPLALITISMFLIETTYSLAFSNKFKYMADKSKESEGNLLESLRLIIERILFIKLNRLKILELERYTKKLNDTIKKVEKMILFQNLHKGIIGTFIGIRQMFIIIVGAYLISIGNLEIGTLLAFNQIMQRAAMPLENIKFVFFSYKDMLSSYERIKPFISNNFICLEKIVDINSDIHLICRNINFKINEKNLFKNFNLTVKKGEKVAIVGKSGAGKSALCKIIAGIYNCEGEIIINSNQNNQYLGFMIDECSLFRGTIRENLTHGSKGKIISDKEIIEVLHKLELMHIIQNSELLDKKMIDKDMLSRGEQQRFEIARLMLLKPLLIILDEPTSALDQNTELVIWNNFLQYCNDSTIIYTTHRLGIIKENHSIYAIDGSYERIKNTQNITINC